MSQASGVFLIVVGMGVAASLMPFDSDTDRSSGQSSMAKAGPTDSLRVASMVPARQPLESAPAVTTPQPATRHGKSLPTAPTHQRASTSSAPVVVTLTHRAEHPAPAKPSSKALPPSSDHVAIAQELQKELRRVGCYDGPVTGLWTPSVRNAMQDFIERVNATLPIERPDNILLALVQGHQGKACGKPCPTGQGLSQEGRCLPNAILARAAKRGTMLAAAPSQSTDRPAPAITGWSTTTAPARSAGPALEGRMALAGPNAETASPSANRMPGPAPDPRARDRQAGPPRVVHRAPPSRLRERPRSNYAQPSAPRRNFADTVFRAPHSTY